MRHRNRAAAFTLVEILVVMVIMLIIILAVIKVSQVMRQNAEIKQTKAAMLVVREALDEYQIRFKGFPDPALNLLGRLEVLPECQAILGRLPEKAVTLMGGVKVFIDAWGQPVAYFYDQAMGNYPELTSAGPDKELNTADDLRLSELVRTR